MTVDALGSILFLRLNIPAKHNHNKIIPTKIATKHTTKMPTPICFGINISRSLRITHNFQWNGKITRTKINQIKIF